MCTSVPIIFYFLGNKVIENRKKLCDVQIFSIECDRAQKSLGIVSNYRYLLPKTKTQYSETSINGHIISIVDDFKFVRKNVCT